MNALPLHSACQTAYTFIAYNIDFHRPTSAIQRMCIGAHFGDIPESKKDHENK